MSNLQKTGYKRSTQPFLRNSGPLIIVDVIPSRNHELDVNLNNSTDIFSETSEETTLNGNKLDDNQEKKVDLVFSVKDLECDKEIAEYLAYLNRPVNVNDRYVELCRHRCESGCSLGNREQNMIPFSTKKTKKDIQKVKILDSKGVSAVKSSGYSEFLVRTELEGNNNNQVETESNLEPEEEFDLHRTLTQSTSRGHLNPSSKYYEETLPKVKRSQTFSVAPRRTEEPLLKHVFSFRVSKKSKGGRRNKRVVVSEEGVEGPMWPTVLRTFDKSISSGSLVSHV